MKNFRLFILPLTAMSVFGAATLMAPASAKANTKSPTTKSQPHKTRHHSSHYLSPSHNPSYDRHDTRSPKWHPTIQEHRHVHD